MNTARCLFSRSKRFEHLEKSCYPCGQSRLQSWEISTNKPNMVAVNSRKIGNFVGKTQYLWITINL